MSGSVNVLKAVILVGGEGTRLRPLTYGLPKAMVPVLNRPFLEHVFERLRIAGVREIVLALGYLPDGIVSHFGDGADWDLSIRYAVEERPLGTAGAVRNLLHHMDDTFLVLNGDIFMDLDIGAMVARHRETGALATLALHEVKDPSPYGVAVLDKAGCVVRFVEKPKGPLFPGFTVNSGLYVVEPEALRLVPEGEFSMFENYLFPLLLESGLPILGHVWQGYWRDMGTPANYLALNHDLLRGEVRDVFQPGASGVELGQNTEVDPAALIQGPVLIGATAHIAAEARIVGPAMIGPGCSIGRKAVVKGSLLWEGVQLESGARVGEAILGKGVIVGRGAQVGNSAVLGDGVIVGPGQKVLAGTILA